MFRVVLVGVMVLMFYWVGKQALGGAANAVLAVFAIFVFFVICQEVFFIEIPPDKTPQVFREPLEGVGEKISEGRGYEYRDIWDDDKESLGDKDVDNSVDNMEGNLAGGFTEVEEDGREGLEQDWEVKSVGEGIEINIKKVSDELVKRLTGRGRGK